MVYDLDGYYKYQISDNLKRPGEFVVYKNELFVFDFAMMEIIIFKKSEKGYIYSRKFNEKFIQAHMTIFNDTLYVSYGNPGKIVVYDINSLKIKYSFDKFVVPGKINIINNNLYISDTGNDMITVYELNGKYVKEFGKYGHQKGEFNGPNTILQIDEELYIVDMINERIQIFNFDLEPTRESIMIEYPKDLGYKNDKLYVLDYFYRINIFKMEYSHL